MHHGLQAAEGWIELGNFSEAAEELHNLPPALKSSIDALRLWTRVYSGSEAWTNLEQVSDLLLHHSPGDPIGVLNKAESLHRLGRSADAVIFLGAFKSLFSDPDAYYNLARYLCANGQTADAASMLGFAFDGNKKLKLKALSDPELELVWRNSKGK